MKNHQNQNNGLLPHAYLILMVAGMLFLLIACLFVGWWIVVGPVPRAVIYIIIAIGLIVGTAILFVGVYCYFSGQSRDK